MNRYIEQFCNNDDAQAKGKLVSLHYVGLDKVISFYKNRNYKSVWVNDQSTTPLFDSALHLLRSSMGYGLDTAMYATHIIGNASRRLSGKELVTARNVDRVAVEMLTTHSLILFLSHLQAGIFKPDSAIYDKMIIPNQDSIPYFLEKSIQAKDFSIAINAMSPKNPHYLEIQKALMEFLSSSKITNEKYPVPYFAKDSTGCRRGVEKMLTVHGYLKNDAGRPVAKEELAKALVGFQTDFGLRNRGNFDTLTVETLRNSTFGLYRKACITLQRIRWSNITTRNYLLVNIPSFMVQLVEEGEIAVTHKIVCGKPDHETPELDSRISHFVLFPEWNVPHKISTKELLPSIKANPKYLEKHNYEIINGKNEVVDASKINWKRYNERNFPYRLRQSSGEGNSLGVIKFYFNSKYGVYLHDTPSKSLFNLNYRAFSHGCMRVQNPFEFAQTLLEFNKGMLHFPKEKLLEMKKYDQQQRFDKFRKDKKSKKDPEEMVEVKKMKQDVIDVKKSTFPMSRVLPIYIRYLTAFVNEKHKLQFYPDLYHKDAPLINQYEKSVERFVIFK
jgi:murein L,D-transpeptidase YcbB/YkuD